MIGGTYSLAEFTYDIAQLIHQLELAPLIIIGHSMGSGIGLRYAGIYPDNVTKYIGIEGISGGPKRMRELAAMPPHEKFVDWIDYTRGIAARVPRRYATFDEALQRMREANKHLTEDQARHLTIHGVNQNEDGTYSWKFDNYVRAFPPIGLAPEETYELYGRISCPTLLVYGNESWASNPETDGRADHFQNAEVAGIAKVADDHVGTVGRKPNYIALDYVHEGDGKRVVEELNDTAPAN